MRRQAIYIYLLYCIIIFTISVRSLNAQQSSYTSSIQKKLLVRDSIDFKNIPLLINTKSNEFSPIPYNGGLMYISDKPIQKGKETFNKIYWTKDASFKIIDKINMNFNNTDTIIKIVKEGKTDDFTAPTSNDNDILIRYKKNRRTLNSVEISFLNFSTDQVFTYNESSKLLIYAKKSKWSKNGIKHWSLWQSYLLNGKLNDKKRIEFEDRNADYLYPFLSEDGSRLYLSSSIKNGQGGYDIYYVNVQGGVVSTNLIAVNSVNTKYDEIAPFIIKDSLFFSSNSEGGLGGFDAYYIIANSKFGVQNMGYPVNSEKDEVGIKKAYNEYYFTTNRNGNFDILNLQYLPVSYAINGVLTYKNDGSLAPNHLMYLKDKDAGIILDSITTDKFANYSFIGKPNREYEFTTLNGDSLYEQFVIQTIPNQHQFNFISYINGRSPKQKADSSNALWVLEQKTKVDSITKYSLNTKFVVHYGFDKSVISNKEKLVLDSLIKKLILLPKVFISVGAFTDCIGSYKYNYRLSVKRGKAVVNYLIKNGLDKQRIIANGYSKKYTISPCLTKYSNKTKSLQQDSRRAEIVLSENKKIDWATLELQRGKNYYDVYNLSNAKSNLTINPNATIDSIRKTLAIAALNEKKEQLLKVKLERIKQDSLKAVQETLAKKVLAENLVQQKQAREQANKIAQDKAVEKAMIAVNEVIIRDSIRKALAIANLITKKDQLLKVKLDRIKQDSLKAVQETLVKKVLTENLVQQKQARDQANKIAHNKAVEKATTAVNEVKIKDSIRKALAIANLITKKDQLLKANLERIKQDSLKAIQETIAKKVLTENLVQQKQARDQANKIAQDKAVEKAMTAVNEVKIQDSIKNASILATLHLKNQQILRKQLVRAKQDSILKAKAEFELIAQVLASKKKTKVSLAADALKVLTAKPTKLVGPTVLIEEDLSKEEILKSLEVLAKLKLEQERIVEYLIKRINKKPILIYVSSDSVSIEIYDNGIHDKDSVSVIYNNRIVVDKQELKVNKPIKFKLKVDKAAKNNELVFIAENLGTEPPNTGIMFITEKSGRQQQIILSTDMTHNEVIYFIRIEKK